MMVVLIIVLVLVIGALVAVVTGRIGLDSMSGAGSTQSFELPEGRLGARGVDAVRFDQALRGYNMGQVDAVLDRLFDEIAQLESRLDVSERTQRDVTEAEVVQFRRRASASDEPDVTAPVRNDDPREVSERDLGAADHRDE